MEAINNVDIQIRTLDDLDCRGKTVLLRLDINSPLDPKTKKIVNLNRIKASLATIKDLLAQGAKLAIIAHQGDTLDYHNLIPLAEHAVILSDLLGVKVRYIDDVAGPAACEAVRALRQGEIVLLGNLRYLTEEVSTFENAVKLKPEEMLNTYLVRRLAPLVDCYVNDAFAAAHRNAPSMVAFQELLPSAGGRQFIAEVTALTRIMQNPARPAVFLLGGAKISDAFGMMQQALEKGIADRILTCGVLGEVMLLAGGYRLGKETEQFIRDRQLDSFIPQAREYMERFPERICCPVDLAYEDGGKRCEVGLHELPVESLLMDIGAKTIEEYELAINSAATVFVNGPAGIYEKPLFAKGTERLWRAFAGAGGFTVMGGGDTVSAAAKFVDLSQISYVCTGGGAMVRFLSGVKLPLLEAMRKAFKRDQ